MGTLRPLTPDGRQDERGVALYYHPGATSFAPHVILREIGCAFELRRIDLSLDQQHSEAFRAVNPRARVPVLVVGEEILTETPAILTYLAQASPQRELLGPDAARTAEWLSWMCSSLHISFAQVFFPQRFSSESEHAQALAETGKKAIRLAFADIDRRMLAPWIMGEAFTVADPYLFVFCRFARLIGMNPTDGAEQLAGWLERVAERPSVQSAMTAEGITPTGRA